jgi:acyl-homoserine-lactone acylase
VALTVAVGLASLAACTSSGSSGSKSNGTTPDKGRNESGGGKVVGSGSRYEATVRRTTDGVPHITGKTVADAAFGQGYAGGQDRTCDLADQVVKIEGQRSRWFGAGTKDANLDSDVQWLGIGIYDRSVADWAKLGAEAKGLFNAYVDGWNTHLNEVGVGGIGGWCKGEKWVRQLKPVEVYA